MKTEQPQNSWENRLKITIIEMLLTGFIGSLPFSTLNTVEAADRPPLPAGHTGSWGTGHTAY